jgi:hypothetical protein
VFSHWKGSVCAASTPVRLTEASRLIDLFVGALREVAEGATGRSGRQSTATKMSNRFEEALSRLRPTLAAVSNLFSAERSHATGRRQGQG